mgnify:CR=1 FL=1
MLQTERKTNMWNICKILLLMLSQQPSKIRNQGHNKDIVWKIWAFMCEKD